MKKGFTLIEIMVVLAIIGILMGLALTSFMGSRKTARDGKRKADLEQVRSALEMRRADCRSYPTGTLYSGNNIICGSATYITIPQDPISGRRYYYSGAVNSYNLCAALEVGGGAVPAGCSGATDCGVQCNYKLTNP